jgi:hypothetical protein
VKPLLVTINDKDRYQPKPSGAKPTSTKPVDKEQRSQVMRDREKWFKIRVRQEEETDGEQVPWL